MLSLHTIKRRLPLRVSQRYSVLAATDVRAAREYIRSYWPQLQRFHPRSDHNLISLPKPYLIPSASDAAHFDFEELYYWDSYFMVQGLLDAEHKELVIGILEDLFSLFRRFEVIPNASRMYLMGRSQPPFLTSFIFDLYETYHLGDTWLASAMKIAKQEYKKVWMGAKKPNDRQVYQGLSRYYDINMLHDLAEAESGWDMTPRFNHRALDFLPVDLNALLYKYETDFARAAKILGDEKEVASWNDAAQTRAATMNKLMWNDDQKFFYDYDYANGKRGKVASLAAYYPMWAGMVDTKQAAALVNALRRFEHVGGLTATEPGSMHRHVRGAIPTQWAYPNGWAPLHLLVITALERYGYHTDARRLAMKWLCCNLTWFNAHHTFLEKYNVVELSKPPAQGVYPTQVGFGWTNAVFERLCRQYIDQGN